MSKWGDSGFLDKIDDEPGNGTAAAVATQEPAAPAAPAGSSQPQGAGDPAAAAPVEPKQPEAPKTETPPAGATAEQIRKWKINGKVAGADKEWEIGEDYFDAAKNPEKHKWLRDQLQKAEDYDRPGGALDKQAEKKAAAIVEKDRVDWLVGQGFAVKNPDGTIVDSPSVAAFKKWKAEQAAGGQPAAAAPAATAQTPTQKRIAELEAVFTKDGGFTAEENREYQSLLIDQRTEQREAEKERKAAEARQKSEQEEARAKTAKSDSDRDRQRIDAHIDNVVTSLADKFKHPITGAVSEGAVRAAKALMRDTALQSQDWAKAEAAVREYAEGHAASLSELSTKVLKTGAAAPPPVARGGSAVPAKKPDEELKDFDSMKGFQKQGGRGFLQRMHEAE